MGNKTNLTLFSEKNFVSLMRNTDSIVQALASEKDFKKVIEAIDKLNVVYTNEQLLYFKSKMW